MSSATIDLQTAFIQAISKHDTKEAVSLLDQKADPNEYHNEATPLTIAVQHRLQLVKNLLSNTAEDAEKLTQLQEIEERCHTLVTKLLEYNANPLMPDIHWRVAADWSAQCDLEKLQKAPNAQNTLSVTETLLENSFSRPRLFFSARPIDSLRQIRTTSEESTLVVTAGTIETCYKTNWNQKIVSGSFKILYPVTTEAPTIVLDMSLKRKTLSPAALRRMAIRTIEIQHRLKDGPHLAFAHLILDTGRSIHFYMPQYNRGSLLEVLQDPQMYPLSSKERLLLTRDILEALYHIHSRGVAHCDIKYDNILVDTKAGAAITDFELSLLPKEITSKSGTPSWFAPEMQDKTKFSTEERQVADVWALGQVLCGIWHPANPQDVNRISMQSIIRRMTSKHVEGRYTMQEALNQFNLIFTS